MNPSTFNCGIDISKDKFDVCLWPGDIWKTFKNSESGLKQFLKWLQSYEIERIVLEASGGYEQLALHTLIEEGLPTVLMNPKRIRYFAMALGLLAKTDKMDARTIAIFSETIQPPLTTLPSQVSS